MLTTTFPENNSNSEFDLEQFRQWFASLSVAEQVAVEGEAHQIIAERVEAKRNEVGSTAFKKWCAGEGFSQTIAKKYAKTCEKLQGIKEQLS